MSSATPATLVLARERERSLLRRHPWVFSGAVAALRGHAERGDTVRVCDHAGKFLALAAYNPSSRIAARVWSFTPDEAIDSAFFAGRVRAALALRETLLDPRALRACRLVHAESDGLPGVVVDRYGELLVLQASSAGAQRHKLAIADTLIAITGASAVYERSEGEALALEGLSEQSGPLLGPAPDAPIEIEEHGLRFAVDVRGGHKTGFYLDQRDNRALVRALAKGRDVLDAFCYSGGFAISAALGGASSVQAVDSSEPALALCARNAESSGLGTYGEHEPDAARSSAIELVRADVFEHLRKARDRGRRFDLIVLDPPKLAPTARLSERASRAYKDINLLAFKLLRPGGLLCTFSCSAGISPELFQKIVAGAALDARVRACVVRKLHAAVDHPISLAFPEGEYLKGLLCSVAP